MLAEHRDRITPCEKIAAEGDTVEFTCFGYKTFRWDWIFEDDSLPDNAVVYPHADSSIMKSTLTLTNVQKYNSGTYECHGYDKNTLEFHAEGILLVMSKCSLDKVVPLTC